MKANYTEFTTRLSIGDCGSLFRRGVDKRPLKLKATRFQYFTPTQDEDPFASVDGSIRPDFEVGAAYELGELYGSVVMSCLVGGDGTLVSLRSAGNMRGRTATNSLVKHLVRLFADADASIQPMESTGRL